LLPYPTVKRILRPQIQKLGLFPISLTLLGVVATLAWLDHRAETLNAQEIEISLGTQQKSEGKPVDWELVLAAGTVVGGVLLWADNRLDTLEGKVALLEQRCINLQDQLSALKADSERHGNRLYRAVSQLAAARKNSGFHPRSQMANGGPWPTDDPPTEIPFAPYDRPPTPPPQDPRQ
jgi:uncharacterized coiled-coil protein SlyX